MSFRTVHTAFTFLSWLVFYISVVMFPTSITVLLLLTDKLVYMSSFGNFENNATNIKDDIEVLYFYASFCFYFLFVCCCCCCCCLLFPQTTLPPSYKKMIDVQLVQHVYKVVVCYDLVFEYFPNTCTLFRCRLHHIFFSSLYTVYKLTRQKMFGLVHISFRNGTGLEEGKKKVRILFIYLFFAWTWGK